ncbi:hypothetical protein Tco_1344996 [Tanacetum coccineum]
MEESFFQPGIGMVMVYLKLMDGFKDCAMDINLMVNYRLVVSGYRTRSSGVGRVGFGLGWVLIGVRGLVGSICDWLRGEDPRICVYKTMDLGFVVCGRL